MIRRLEVTFLTDEDIFTASRKFRDQTILHPSLAGFLTRQPTSSSVEVSPSILVQLSGCRTLNIFFQHFFGFPCGPQPALESSVLTG